jgi:hypothetical protein
MPISRYIVTAVASVLARLLALAGAPVEFAETEVTVGDKGPAPLTTLGLIGLLPL